MNYGTVERPKFEEKISSNDEFELCYLRHQYIRKSKHNPTEAEMQPYRWIINNFVGNSLYVYGPLLIAVGIGREDLTSIAQMQLVSYLGLFSMDHNETKRKEFTDVFRYQKLKDPLEKDFLDKDKAAFTCFLKQRMEDVIRVCRQKSKNINGKVLEEYTCFSGPVTPPKNPRDILKDHYSYGYKSLNAIAFKKIRKHANVENDASLFQHDGLWYVAFAMEYLPLTFDEILGSGHTPWENAHNMGPLELIEENEFNSLTTRFEGLSVTQKIRKLKGFLQTHSHSKYFKKEIRTAKATLRKLGA